MLKLNEKPAHDHLRYYKVSPVAKLYIHLKLSVMNNFLSHIMAPGSGCFPIMPSCNDSRLV